MKVRPQLRKEHVHFRPESYIGSHGEIHERTWIIENGTPTLKIIAFIPAVLKLCEELITNAVQHGLSHPSAHIELAVTENGTITVTNNGAISFGESAQIPTVGELQAVFGEEEIGSELYERGRGVKLVNMFSRNFFVEMGSQQHGEAIKLVWRDCLSLAEPPKTIPYDRRDYTKVRAALDLPRFRLTKFSQDFIGLLERRAWDVAALHSRQVIFNGRTPNFKGFSEYAAKFASGGAVQVEEVAGWRVAVGPSDHGFQQLSFVNGCYWTRTGGTHVNIVIAEIATRALQLHRKRLKDPSEVMHSPGRFTSNYVVIVDVAIEVPQFSSLLRDCLLTVKLPTPFRLSDSVLDFLEKHQALKAYREMARKRELLKGGEARTGEAVVLPRLEDAGKAGSSSRCTLLLVQNEATRQLMAAGLECVSREYFGIYTLRGKPPNARENKHVSENADFVAIAKALGLSPAVQSVQELRYGSVLIVADQDSEGIAVKGLLLNFFEFALPWALRSRGFVKLLVVPVVRVVNSVGNVKEFLSERDYRSWSSLNSPNEWTPTRFGSIGSMDPLHMRDLFADRKKYSFAVTYQTPLDETALALPYGPDADARRKWLEDHRAESVLDYNTNSKAVPLRQFVDRELAHVFYNEAARGLPCVVDGLTTTQRSALCCLIRQGQEMPLDRLVAQAQQESFEDSEALRKALIRLGQSYVGANNLPVVEGVGQFGTRMFGGKDHAPSRHLRVALPSYLRLLFPAEDDDLLQYSEQQPVHYVPILPLLLVNGFSQTPTLWKSSVLPHKVSDAIEALKERLNKGAGKMVLLPGWEGFKGTVSLQKNSFTVQGVYEPRCTRTVLVKEVPPSQTLQEYRAALEGREEVEEVKEELRGESSVLVVRFREGRVPRDLAQYLQLTASLQQTTAMLISSNGKPRRYKNHCEILEEYLQVRLKLYERRKEATVARLQRSIELLSEKIRFIRDVLGGEFSLADSEEAWRLKFVRKGYKRYQDLPRLPARAPDPFRDFQHLERLPMSQFSERRVSQLRAEKVELEEKLVRLRRTEEKEIWLGELVQFEERWRKGLRLREQLLFESLRRAENFHRREPSEPSLARRQRPALEFEDISLDSQACAELEASRTQGLSEAEPPSRPSKPKPSSIKKPTAEGKEAERRAGEGPENQETLEAIAKAQFLAQRRRFQVQIREMERKNTEFQERLKREAEAAKREAERARKLEMVEKQRKRETERAKQEELQLQRAKEAREKEARAAKEKANVHKEAKDRRDLLGRHAMAIGKKVEEDQRRLRQEKAEQSEKSNRNHLPLPNGPTHRITVPYPCDSSTFQVIQVERKRFSTKDIKVDQAEINRIHADMRREEEEEEQRATRVNTCIELD